MGDKRNIPTKPFLVKDEMNCNTILGENLRYARKYLKIPEMTREDLEKEIGISADTIKNIEKGRGAKSDILCKLANVFNVSVDWFMTDHSESEEVNFSILSCAVNALSVIENQVKKMSLEVGGYDDLLEEVDVLKRENESLKKEIEKLKKKK